VYVLPATPDPCPIRRLTREHTVAKTRSQLNRKLPDGQKLPWPPFGKQWYAGCTTLIIGNSAKAAIRKWPPQANHPDGEALFRAPVC
jgi:hypothetical protein